MKVVDENLSIKEIEKRIGHGIVEELILQAHNEIKLIRIMKGIFVVLHSQFSRMAALGSSV
jgi:hypothetical protein